MAEQRKLIVFLELGDSDIDVVEFPVSVLRSNIKKNKLVDIHVVRNLRYVSKGKTWQYIDPTDPHARGEVLLDKDTSYLIITNKEFAVNTSAFLDNVVIIHGYEKVKDRFNSIPAKVMSYNLTAYTYGLQDIFTTISKYYPEYFDTDAYSKYLVGSDNVINRGLSVISSLYVTLANYKIRKRITDNDYGFLQSRVLEYTTLDELHKLTAFLDKHDGLDSGVSAVYRYYVAKWQSVKTYSSKAHKAFVKELRKTIDGELKYGFGLENMCNLIYAYELIAHRPDWFDKYSAEQVLQDRFALPYIGEFDNLFVVIAKEDGLLNNFPIDIALSNNNAILILDKGKTVTISGTLDKKYVSNFNNLLTHVLSSSSRFHKHTVKLSITYK